MMIDYFARMTSVVAVMCMSAALITFSYVQILEAMVAYVIILQGTVT